MLQNVGGKKHEVKDGGSSARRCAQTTLRHSVGEILNPGNEIELQMFSGHSINITCDYMELRSDNIVGWKCDHALDCLTVIYV